MIKKLKSIFKKTRKIAAIMLVSLTLLSPKSANAQRIYYEVFPPWPAPWVRLRQQPLSGPWPRFYYQKPIERIPIGTGLDFSGFRMPMGQGYDRLLSELSEEKGEKIIAEYLHDKGISFKKNSTLRFRTKEELLVLLEGPYQSPDFQLMDKKFRKDEVLKEPKFRNIIIEYLSPEDQQITDLINRDYAFFEQDIKNLETAITIDWSLPESLKPRIFFRELDLRGIRYEINPISTTASTVVSETTPKTNSTEKNSISTISGIKYKIIKPLFFLDKKDILKKYEEEAQIGKKVYFIESKDIKDVVSIEQKLDTILEKIIKR